MERSIFLAAADVQTDLEKLKPDVIMDTIKSWMPGMLGFGGRLLVAALILIIGIRVIRMVRKFLKKTFDRMDMDLSVSKYLLAVVDAALYTLVIFIAADKIGIPSASIIALLGSAGLAIGLALQGSLANVAGGILILLMRPFSVGDYITCKEAEGTVSSIGLVYTTLLTVDNKMVTVPNGIISNITVVNTTAQEKRRLNLELSINYRSDLKQVKQVLRRIYEEHPKILKNEEIVVFVSELAQNGVIVAVRGWTRKDDYWNTRWDILETIKETFDAEGIELSFSQLDIHIKEDSGEIPSPSHTWPPEQG